MEKAQYQIEKETFQNKQVKRLYLFFVPIISTLILNTYFSYLTYESASRLQAEKVSLDLTVENRKSYNSILIEKNQFLIKQQSKLNFHRLYGWKDFYDAQKAKDSSQMKSIFNKIEDDFFERWNIYQNCKSFLSETNILSIDKFINYTNVDGNHSLSANCERLFAQKSIGYFYGISEFIYEKKYLHENTKLTDTELQIYAIQYFPIVLNEVIGDELKTNADRLLRESKM